MGTGSRDKEHWQEENQKTLRGKSIEEIRRRAVAESRLDGHQHPGASLRTEL